MPYLRMPPKFFQQQLLAAYLCLFFAVLSPFFLALFVFCVIMLFLNSIIMFRELRKYGKRGLLRYFYGRVPPKG